VSCIFCRIAAGEIPAKIVHEEPDVLAFRDIDPKAPTHILVIPRRHIGSLNDLTDADAALAARMLLVARQVAAQEGLAAPGYRVIMNTGRDGGQSVDHLHLHLLGGRAMRWPPG
jgi:histidine triad (HIT) family protein